MDNRNTRGGKGYKKRKTNRERFRPESKVSINVANGEGYFASIIRFLGDNKVEIKRSNDTIAQATIPGKFYKRRWIKNNDIVLVNTENEIVKIIKNNDTDSKMAQNMMAKLEKSNGGNIYLNSDSESDSDDDLKIQQTIPKKNISYNNDDLVLINPNFELINPNRIKNKDRLGDQNNNQTTTENKDEPSSIDIDDI